MCCVKWMQLKAIFHFDNSAYTSLSPGFNDHHNSKNKYPTGRAGLPTWQSVKLPQCPRAPKGPIFTVCQLFFCGDLINCKLVWKYVQLNNNITYK